jgi:HK97 family phage major capsid protein/HK97 family phage prohead protease
MERFEVKASITVDDAGAITGIAWPFGTADRVGDVIEKGSFSAPARLPMLFAHDQAQAIGVWDSITETVDGLTVKGRLLIDDVARAREVRALVREGAVTGLSIGFVTKKAAARKGGGRNISALDLHEVSIVPIPSHPGARIISAKAISAPNPEGLMALEEKAVAPDFATLETKIGEVAETVKSFGKVTDRLDKMEARLNRPANDNIRTANDNEPNAERKAFTGYMRSGRSEVVEAKALRVSTDPNAGYFAPTEFSTEFVRDLVQFSPIRSIASVKQTSQPSVTLGKRTGVTNAKWKGENETSESSEPAFGQLEVPTKEINTYVDISNQLLQDNVADVEGEVRLALAEDFGAKEGTSFVNGDGQLSPKGFMRNDAILSSLNGHATVLSADALITLLYALPAAYRNSGTWVMNGTTLATLRKLKDGQGNFLWQPSYQAGQPETILSRPVVEAIDMPDVAANAFPIIYGNFAGYRIVDRIDLSLLVNPFLLATNGMTRFHATRRVGGDVIQPRGFLKLKMATA